MAIIDSTETDATAFARSLQALNGNKELLFQIVNMFPLPVEIFSPDGTIVFANRASLEFNNIPDISLVAGKINLLKDPIYNDRLGLKDIIQRGFNGEAVSCQFPSPIRDLVNRGIINEKPYESALMDACFYPVWDGEALAFVVCVFIVKRLFKGRPEISRVQEYIDINWKKKFDPRSCAQSVEVSVAQLYKVFKKHTGMTPGDYYRKCKVEHIKEKLADKSLSVKEAFADCGEDSRGAYSKVFKKLCGVSPNKYRNQFVGY